MTRLGEDVGIGGARKIRIGKHLDEDKDETAVDDEDEDEEKGTEVAVVVVVEGIISFGLLYYCVRSTSIINIKSNGRPPTPLPRSNK